MSIVIIGGNECMERKYKELCKKYSCEAKVYTKMSRGMSGMGSPDLLVLFTGTVSHKMLRCALSGVKGQDVTIARSHSSSMNALRSILEEHAGKREA